MTRYKQRDHGIILDHPQGEVNIKQGGVQMSNDTYHIDTAGIVAPHSKIENLNFTQIGKSIEESVDLSKLADELSELRQAMKKEAVEAEQDIAVSEVAKAEQAAKAKNASKVAEHLKAAGKWALDVAIKISMPVAIEALKKSLGFV